MFILHQAIQYEDSFIYYSGYVSGLTRDTVTISFDPFTVKCQEGFIYRGFGEETVLIYDQAVYSDLNYLLTRAEIKDIKKRQDLYRLCCNLGYAIINIWKYDKTLHMFSGEQSAKLLHVLKEEFYTVSKSDMQDLLIMAIHDLHNKKLSMIQISKITGLRLRLIKELLKDA